MADANSKFRKVAKLTKRGVNVVLFHRDTMQRRAGLARARLPGALPPTTLPVDVTGNASVSCPMDDNDNYGICGPAMCAHTTGIWTFGQGKAGWTEWLADVSKLLSQYLQVSGGDNGTDEDMLVGSQGIWKTGLAGDPTAIVVDALDVDVTNVPLAQYLIDQFYAIHMAWSVPDDFLSNFDQGTVWANADTPDPWNGHYTPLADVAGPADNSGGVALNGFYRLWTWGTWCWVSPAFVASVQPECFVAFSPCQFSLKTGLDSKGRHIRTQAAAWVSVGGTPIAESVLAKFPPLGPPVSGAPYTLWELTKQVGTITGYPDLMTATAAGQTIANSDNVIVQVDDNTGTTVATLTPGVQPVPAGNKLVLSTTLGPGSYDVGGAGLTTADVALLQQAQSNIGSVLGSEDHERAFTLAILGIIHQHASPDFHRTIEKVSLQVLAGAVPKGSIFTCILPLILALFTGGGLPAALTAFLTCMATGGGERS